MKSANQMREYVQRRWLQEVATEKLYRSSSGPSFSSVRITVLLEILNAFDAPHKTKLKMPRMP